MQDWFFDYTSGYPYLVSRICKLLDEKIAESGELSGRAAAWTTQGFLEAVRILLSEKIRCLNHWWIKFRGSTGLQKMLCDILFGGQRIVYNPDDPTIDIAMLFGFIKNEEGTVVVANRIFETRLYNYFLTTNEVASF